LSVLPTGRLYPQKIFLVLISVRDGVYPKAYRAAGRILLMKKSGVTIGKQ
jgi:hypothetical protein